MGKRISLDNVYRPRKAVAGKKAVAPKPEPTKPIKRGPGRPRTSTPEKRREYLAMKARERRARLKAEKEVKA